MIFTCKIKIKKEKVHFLSKKGGLSFLFCFIINKLGL